MKDHHNSVLQFPISDSLREYLTSFTRRCTYIKREEEIKSKIEIVESDSELTRNHPKPTNQ